MGDLRMFFPNIGFAEELDLAMNERPIRKRYWWVGAYFVVAGIMAVFAMVFLTGLGAAQAAMSAGSGSVGGRDPSAFGTAIYSGIGAVASCISRVKVRAFLVIVAHFAMLIIGVFPPWDYDLSPEFVNGLILCGFLAVPFGWAWFVLI